MIGAYCNSTLGREEEGLVRTHLQDRCSIIPKKKEISFTTFIKILFCSSSNERSICAQSATERPTSTSIVYRVGKRRRVPRGRSIGIRFAASISWIVPSMWCSFGEDCLFCIAGKLSPCAPRAIGLLSSVVFYQAAARSGRTPMAPALKSGGVPYTAEDIVKKSD